MNENEAQAAVYRMNPATDRIIFGDELEEGMQVLPESPATRGNAGGTEEELVRAQRFRRVTRLRIEPGHDCTQTPFAGERADGYQEVRPGN